VVRAPVERGLFVREAAGVFPVDAARLRGALVPVAFVVARVAFFGAARFAAARFGALRGVVSVFEPALLVVARLPALFVFFVALFAVSEALVRALVAGRLPADAVRVVVFEAMVRPSAAAG